MLEAGSGIAIREAPPCGRGGGGGGGHNLGTSRAVSLSRKLEKGRGEA